MHFQQKAFLQYGQGWRWTNSVSNFFFLNEGQVCTAKEQQRVDEQGKGEAHQVGVPGVCLRVRVHKNEEVPRYSPENIKMKI